MVDRTLGKFEPGPFYSGDWHDRAVCQRGGLRLVRALRQERAHFRWQEEGGGQRQEREQIPVLGVLGGGALRGALLPTGEAFL